MPEPKLSLLRAPTSAIQSAPQRVFPQALHRLRERSEDFQHLLIYLLLPIPLLIEFGTDPITLRNDEGQVMLETASSEDGASWGLRLLNDIDRRYPLLELEMADTPFGRISVTWVGMNDPRSPVTWQCLSS
ncbi:MAG: hypothetical protein GY759_23150 [Chloroflexi bacterium]|nr:hypothetical protein [Chloroflexota bacterium]